MARVRESYYWLYVWLPGARWPRRVGAGSLDGCYVAAAALGAARVELVPSRGPAW